MLNIWCKFFIFNSFYILWNIRNGARSPLPGLLQNIWKRMMCPSHGNPGIEKNLLQPALLFRYPTSYSLFSEIQTWPFFSVFKPDLLFSDFRFNLFSVFRLALFSVFRPDLLFSVFRPDLFSVFRLDLLFSVFRLDLFSVFRLDLFSVFRPDL